MENLQIAFLISFKKDFKIWEFLAREWGELEMMVVACILLLLCKAFTKSAYVCVQRSTERTRKVRLARVVSLAQCAIIQTISPIK